MDGVNKWESDLERILTNHNEFQLYQALLTVNSLTLGLKNLSSQFSVELLKLGGSETYVDEIQFFSSKKVFSREVYLQLDNKRVVRARTICPLIENPWLGILDCGVAPLGYRLFDGTLPITRSPFEYALLDEQGSKFNAEKIDSIARRSLFLWDDYPLLVVEQYLSPLKKYIDRNIKRF